MINAVNFYRIGHCLWKWKIPIIPRIIKLIIFLAYNCSIPYQCEIGKGSYFAYGGIGVLIHKNAKIGRNVVIGSGVTIGGRGGERGEPRIGDNVYCATGCKILGNIEIGSYVFIGANSVVIKSVSSNTIVAGVPARVIRTGITKDEYFQL